MDRKSGITYDAKGKKYELRLMTRRMKNQLADCVFKHKRNLLRKIRDDLPVERYEAKLQQLCDDYEAGKFSIEQPEGKKYFESSEGRLKIASLIFGCDEDEMMQLLLDDACEVGKVIELVAKKSLRIYKGNDKDSDTDSKN